MRCVPEVPAAPAPEDCRGGPLASAFLVCWAPAVAVPAEVAPRGVLVPFAFPADWLENGFLGRMSSESEDSEVSLSLLNVERESDPESSSGCSNVHSRFNSRLSTVSGGML